MAACFDAAYTASPGTATSPASDTIVTTCPLDWPRMTSRAARVPFIAPKPLTSIINRRVFSSCSQAGPVTSTPALLTQRPSDPTLSLVAWAMSRHACASRTSSAEANPSCPISAAAALAAAKSTSVTCTAYPRSASIPANARPKPRPAPVTTAPLAPGTVIVSRGRAGRS